MKVLQTDTPLVEFNGYLRDSVVRLRNLLGEKQKRYPPANALWWDTKEALEVYSELLNRLNAKAPEGYYFGDHPKMPFCLGFWPKTPERT